MKQLILYSTTGCHLCELAKEQVSPLLEQFSLELVEVDIADQGNEILLEKYGVRIPVIRLEGHMSDLSWPFDVYNVTQFLAEAYKV